VNKQDIQNKLRALKPEIMLKYKIKEIGLFGSYARGEERRGSDIDLLVDFADDASFFDLVRLGDFLEARLRRKVDLISKRALRKELRRQVLQEVIMI
jgi:predicted nucleotidyltransferase